MYHGQRGWQGMNKQFLHCFVLHTRTFPHLIAQRPRSAMTLYKYIIHAIKIIENTYCFFLIFL